MVCGVLWQFPCAIWGQPRWLFSYNDRQKAKPYTVSHLWRTAVLLVCFKRARDDFRCSGRQRMLYLWYNEPLTGVIYTRHESENQNWQKEGKEQKSSTERLRKDWRTMCLSCPSFQSTGKPASGRKKKERKCGKVTLDGDVGGICSRRRTFWKVVGWSHWSPTSSSPPPLIILRAYWWQHKNRANIWLKKGQRVKGLSMWHDQFDKQSLRDR